MKAHQEEYGLNRSLALIGLSKSSWYYNQNKKVALADKYAYLRPVLEEIALTHPEYGYRRVGHELNREHGQVINHKVLQKLNQLWGLPLMRSTRKPKVSKIRKAIAIAGDRVNLVAQKVEIQPFEVLYTDFTEIRYCSGLYKAYLMPILEHGTRGVLGWAIGFSANTDLAFAAWQRARAFLENWKIDISGIIMHQDQGSVYTGYRWVGKLLLEDHLRVSYSLNGAKGNTIMESFFSRFKEENRSLFFEADTFSALVEVVRERIEYYNYLRLHSSIGYKTPMEVLEQALFHHRRPHYLHC